MLPQVTGLFRVKPSIPGETVCVTAPPSFSVSPNHTVSIQGDWLDVLFLLAAIFFHLQWLL